MRKEKRFVVTHKESGVRVLVDRQSGVNYLYFVSGYGGGITPLLDRNGKVIVTSVPFEE